jgi:hypothetical protein
MQGFTQVITYVCSTSLSLPKTPYISESPKQYTKEINQKLKVYIEQLSLSPYNLSPSYCSNCFQMCPSSVCQSQIKCLQKDWVLFTFFSPPSKNITCYLSVIWGAHFFILYTCAYLIRLQEIWRTAGTVS